MTGAWRELRVEDRVRIVRMPSEAGRPGATFLPGTRLAYRRLIERRRSVRISRVDCDGLPWICCRLRGEDGAWEHHWLALNDDSWARVKPRNRTETRPKHRDGIPRDRP